MNDKRVFLKVKLKSLAEEARIIKREESKRKVPRPKRFGHQDPEYRRVAKLDRANDGLRRAARRGRDWYPMSAQELHELHRHRIDVVRMEARLTGIAYAVIRGRQLTKVDSLNGLQVRDWERVQSMLRKYGDSACPVTKSMTSLKPGELFEAMAETGKGLAVKQAA